MKKPVIKNYIEKKLEEISSQRIATINEIMEHLTAVMRNEITEEVVVVEGTGEGFSKATIANKGMSEKDRLKAAELLGKRYGMFTEKIKLDMPVPIVISGEDKLED